ncbi:hypothetical protein F4811DRAFT_525972 [Daldinia bambusicola]|nr:hypothetical protein F4811DRAFT_525972 [Daldinia bambusicola]
MVENQALFADTTSEEGEFIPQKFRATRLLPTYFVYPRNEVTTTHPWGNRLPRRHTTHVSVFPRPKLHVVIFIARSQRYLGLRKRKRSAERLKAQVVAFLLITFASYLIGTRLRVGRIKVDRKFTIVLLFLPFLLLPRQWIVRNAVNASTIHGSGNFIQQGGVNVTLITVKHIYVVSQDHEVEHKQPLS